MLVNALRAEIPLETFLASTLWEVGQMVDASIWRSQQDRKLLVYHAWHVAALASAAFAGKMPPLKRLLKEKPKPGRQSAEAALAAMQQIGSLLGMKYGES